MSAATAKTYADPEVFNDAELSDTLVVRDADGLIWTAFEPEQGGWLAVRPRNEDDDKGPDGDRWRPLGPLDLELLRFPIKCVPAHDVLATADCSCGAVEYGDMTQHLAPCLGGSR